MNRLLLLGIAAPLALCAAVLAAAWRARRREAPPGAGRWAGGPAFGMAFMLAGLGAGTYWRFPPLSSWEWIVYLAGAAALLGAAEALRWLPRWPAHTGLACAAATLLVGTWADHYWVWRGGAAVVMLVTLAALDALRDRRAVATSLGLCAVFTGASVILALAPTLKLAVLAACMAACLGAAALLALWRPRVAPLAAATPVLAVTLQGLLLAGLTTTDERAWPFLMCAAAPAGLLIPRDPALRVACVAGAVLVAVAGAAIP